MANDERPESVFAQAIPKAPELKRQDVLYEVPTLPPDLGNDQQPNTHVSATQAVPTLFSAPVGEVLLPPVAQPTFSGDDSTIGTIECETEKVVDTLSPSESPLSAPSTIPSQCPALEIFTQQSTAIESISLGLQEVTTEVTGLKTAFQREIADQSLQRLNFEKLHREMLDYKENFLQKAMEPLFRQLIGWADHFEEIISQDNVSKGDLSFLYDELIDALNRYGVEQFSSDNDIFEPSLQKVVKTEPVGDETLNRSIARRVKPGYRQNGRLMRPEQVVAYKYDTSLQVIPVDNQVSDEQPIEEVRTDE
ncbi:MAG: nucleotide exchange factor GrpE [bacterium]